MPVERNDKPSTSRRLAQKACLITGTGGSIGRAIALAFAQEGASIVGCDVNVESAESTVELVQGAGGEMVSIQPCRLDDPSDCQALIELAVGTYRRIDVLATLPRPRTTTGSRTSRTRSEIGLAGARSTWSSTSPVRRGHT